MATAVLVSKYEMSMIKSEHAIIRRDTTTYEICNGMFKIFSKDSEVFTMIYDKVLIEDHDNHECVRLTVSYLDLIKFYTK